MRKSSDDLFQLIRSLTKSEKRHFKLFVSKYSTGESSTYLKLFSAIEKQKMMDDSVLKKQYGGGHFKVIKNYLYKLILRSLHIDHSDISIDSQLGELLHHAEILYEKALYLQYKKVLSKAKKIAYQYERYTLLPEILRLEKKLMMIVFISDISETEISRIVNEERLVSGKLTNINGYWDIFAKSLIHVVKRGKARTSSDIRDLEKIIANPLMSNKEHANSYDALAYYYFTYGNYYRIKSDFKNCYKYRKECVLLMDKHPPQIAENPNNYINALNNFLIICFELKKYDDIQFYFSKLKTIPVKSEHTKIHLFRRYYIIGIDLYIETAEFKKGIQLIGEVEQGLLKYKGKINKFDELGFYFQFVLLYFGSEEYSQALKWLNKFLNDPQTTIREDIYCYSKILNLIIHFELNNFDLMEYIIKSTYRYLYKKNKLYKFENVILNFLRKKTNNISNKKELVIALKDLRNELVEIYKDPFESKAFGFLHFLYWLDSKIEKRPFAEIVKSKALLV